MTWSEPGLAVTAEFRYRPEQLVIAVRGEIDALTADDFEELLGGVHFKGDVTLDLAEASFFSASGLRVVASFARRLQGDGGTLRVRSASSFTQRLFDITDTTELVTFSEPVEVAAAPESRPYASRESDQLLAALADAVVPMLGEEIAERSMDVLARTANALMTHLAAASVTMRRRDRFVTVAHTDVVARELDETQYAAGAGPCVKAASTGKAVHAHPGGDTVAWEAIAHDANRRSIGAVLSTPLFHTSNPVGALNLYAAEDVFTDTERELASLLTRESTTVFDTQLTKPQLMERLTDALASRQTIALAQGMLMERNAISAAEGYNQLRRDANKREIPLREFAQATVDLPFRERGSETS